MLLRLSSRGITEVEQTDVQVRLQEIWRDRKEEVMVGIGRMEQHYEHILSECSTEISELEGSIGHKYAAIAKLQEELLVLSMRKDRVTEDMEKVRQSTLNLTSPQNRKYKLSFTLVSSSIQLL